MAAITVRNLDEQTHSLLKMRAAKNGRSVEAEVRDILDKSVSTPGPNILLAIRNEFADNPIDLETPPRDSLPRSVDFS